MSQKVAFIMAGGTGGHVFPALALADRLQQSNWQVIWLGSENGIESHVVPAHGYRLESIAVKGMRGHGLMRYLHAPRMIYQAVKQAFQLYRRYQPNIAVGFGGFASFPGGVAAKLSGCPLIVHEQNAVAGLSNRILALWAKAVFTGFPRAFNLPSKSPLANWLPLPSALTWIGNPVRDSIISISNPELRYQQRTGPLHLLIIGGSQGARALNRIIPEALAQLPKEKRPVVIHQGGPKLYEELVQCYQHHQVEAQLVPFIEDMAQAYQQTDLVICRAGALTVAELTCAGVASLLVPFPSAVDDHQTLNARFLEEHQAAYLIQQKELTVEGLVKLLNHLTRQDLSIMAQRAYALAKRNATDELRQVCEEWVHAA